jgi:hypothetical protein
MEALNSALALIRRILHTVDEGLEASAVSPAAARVDLAATGTSTVAKPPEPSESVRPIGAPCLAQPPSATALESPGEQGFDELQDLLDSIGAEPAAPDPDAQLRLKDATISELTSMLAALRPLGDQLAATERARLDLKERTERLGDEVAELRRLLVLASDELEDDRERFELRIEQEAEHASAPNPLHDEAVADYEARLAEAVEALAASVKSTQVLEAKLADRERVLAGERERHTATREKLAERKRIAAERWSEIRSLRAELKQKS